MSLNTSSNASSFTIYPAIDLKSGRAVRLAEGDMDRATIYNDDPGAQAAEFGKAGARWLHVVDLDGAFAGKNVNGESVERILTTFPGRVQLGGGIRGLGQVTAWFERGVDRIVIGTAALKDPDFVREAAKKYPGRIVVAVDAKDGMVAVEGWAETSDLSAVELARRFEDAGVAALLFTDVGRDGLLKGVNVTATEALAKAQSLPVIASGGVAGMDDIDALLGVETSGVSGVICGRAIYDGRLSLRAALERAF